jgi:beta-galactosidase
VNRVLASRYGGHPSVLLWHLSNEYGGDCHCELCQEAFRSWLRRRYRDDLDNLNRAWWTSFWGHVYSDWSQIRSPSRFGDTSVHCQNLDWKRFVTDQTVDFIRAEAAPLRELAPGLPITTNLMGTYDGLDYFRIAAELDLVSWDSYPCWHGPGTSPAVCGSRDPGGRDWALASDVAFVHDLTRCLKPGHPFMLMESTPSTTNWHSVCKLKRPGMHMLSSLQAVAHGSDTVQYFQWRKSRGSAEKLHGAVVDHAGHGTTRVFTDVAEVGAALAKLDAVVGTAVQAEVALIFDWENRWALEDAQGPLNDGRKAYERTCKDHYLSFWKRGIAVDVVNEDRDISGYKLLVAPMLYMVRHGLGERLDRFVQEGGTLVATYWSGIVDESDLCFLGGFPGPLRTVMGIWSEEIDALYPGERNAMLVGRGGLPGLAGRWEVQDLCDLIHAETADVIGRYAGDFYAGRPALTVNRHGKGRAYYLAARPEQRFLDQLARSLEGHLGLERAVRAPLPLGVSARIRQDDRGRFLFLMNFTTRRQRVSLEPGWRDLLRGLDPGRSAVLEPYGVRVLQKMQHAG